jgi:transposase
VASEPPMSADPRDLTEARLVIAALQEQLQQSQREVAALRHELDVLCRRLFGRKADRVDPRQLALALEQRGNEPGDVTTPVEMDSGETPVRAHRRKRPTGRRPLPPHLPRQVVLVDVPESEKQCGCGRQKERIGEDVTEKLEYTPASFSIVATTRPKYACPSCHEGVVQATAPPQAVEKSVAGEGLLAQVVVSKYVDHLPLYRQEQIYLRQGVDLPRTTLCEWIGAVATTLAPIGEQLRREVTACDYLQTDDTPVTILTEQGGSIKGRIWVYLDPIGRQVVFDATATHERDGPAAFLAAFEGKLHADAYKGYDERYATGRVLEIGCWAHARRHVVDAFPTAPEAALLIALIKELYEIERAGADVSPDARLALRQDQSVAVLARIDEVRQALTKTVLPKSPLGGALGYIHNQWQALNRFVEDGRLYIDNNGAENQLRVVAVGRKNWLFAGSLDGARRAALLYSLVQSCKLAGVEPFHYLKDVLLRVATHPYSRLNELTPRGWTRTFAQPAAAA